MITNCGSQILQGSLENRSVGIYRSSQSLEDFATDLLLKLWKKRNSRKLLEFITIEMQQSVDLVRKEAFLLVLGCVVGHPNPYQIDVKQDKILIDILLCELTSSIGFMRYRAACVYSKVSCKPTPNSNINALVTEEVCRLLIDPELPVRYKASLALPNLIKYWNTDRLSERKSK